MSEKPKHETHNCLVILENGKEYEVKDTIPSLLKRIKNYMQRKKNKC